MERFSASAVLLIKTPESECPALPVRPCAVPGDVMLPEIAPGCRLRAERPIQWKGPMPRERWQVVLRGDLPAPFTVRSRWPGDRLRPVGLGGSKKVQDLLVDRKVARRIRNLVPVVADATGRIVWVVGHAADEAAVAPASASDVIVLTFEPPVVPGSEGK
ncbi:MAG: tRNA lysidine(34) synthetase TilS [Planctomycetota bacterium]